jgi:hypothetical protein
MPAIVITMKLPPTPKAAIKRVVALIANMQSGPAVVFRSALTSDCRHLYGFLATQAPAAHFRFEGVVTTALPLFDGVTGAVCLGVAPVGPGAVAFPIGVAEPPIEPCLFTLPTVAGFVGAAVEAVAPPITGAGFEAPPIAFCFVLAGPPNAFWAREGQTTPAESAPIDIPSTIILIVRLFFMDAIFLSLGGYQRIRRLTSPAPSSGRSPITSIGGKMLTYLARASRIKRIRPSSDFGANPRSHQLYSPRAQQASRRCLSGCIGRSRLMKTSLVRRTPRDGDVRLQ